jgi:Predicted metal binding domain
MIVDPAVSRRKFAREVEAARAHDPFRRQGVWIMRAEYPIVFAILATNHPVPVLPGVLCGVHLDFSDYDVRPPSIKFVDPFEEKPLSVNTCWGFPRKVRDIVNTETGEVVEELQNLLVAFNPEKPFICLQGVREYHECSAHSGDSWFLHRKPNMLVHLLSILHQYGPNAVGIRLQVNHQLAMKAVS